MKTHFISVVVSLAVVVAAGGCIAGASKNLNTSDIPEQTPKQATPVNVGTSPLDRSKDSYLIYSAILNNKWDKGNIVVRDHTDRGLFQNDEWLDSNVGKTYPEAVSDFNKSNEKDTQLENRFDYSGNISLIDEQEFKKTIGGGDGWDTFKKTHPGASGIVTFSAVGFDRDGTHALVNVSYLCWSHCGNGSVYILEKKNDQWTIAQEIGTWMS